MTGAPLTGIRRPGMSVTVRPGGPSDAPFAAALHVSEIREGFLPTLGEPFLRRLYRRIAVLPDASLLVASADGRPCGFAAVTDDVDRLYRAFVLRDGVPAALVAAPRVLRSWRRVLETLRYPAAAGDATAAEVLAVAVSADVRGCGVGRVLVESALARFAERGVAAARVVTASHNVAALALYGGAGFRPLAAVQVHEGADSQVLLWP